MFLDEIEVLENESDAIKNFEFDLPKESASARKRAEKMAANNLFEGMDLDDIIVVGSNQKESNIVFSTKFVGGVGLTTGLDFSKLAEENPEWENEPIFLATTKDLRAFNFLVKGDQNEERRELKEEKKRLKEMGMLNPVSEMEDDSDDDSDDSDDSED